MRLAPTFKFVSNSTFSGRRFPSLLQSSFCVHERRVFHPRAEFGAKLGQGFRIGGDRFCDVEKSVVGGRDELGEGEVGELADAGAGDGGAANAGDGGDAHPESVEAGGVAVIGEGVEAEVNAVVEAHIVGAGAAVEEFDASGGEVEFFEDAVSQFSDRGEEEEAGGGKGVEDGGPEGEGAVVDLAEVVEAAEGGASHH